MYIIESKTSKYQQHSASIALSHVLTNFLWPTNSTVPHIRRRLLFNPIQLTIHLNHRCVGRSRADLR